MEKYRLGWLPSVSDFADSQQVIGKVNNGAEQVLANLEMTSNNAVLDLPTDAQVEWWVRTTGDNGTSADSAHDSFVARNAQQVQAASALTHTFIQHAP